MNYQKAIQIMELGNSCIDIVVIKKQYKRLALKYHPDKNHEIDTSEKFIEITNSYEFLCDYLHMNHMKDDLKNIPYSELLHSFLNNIFTENIVNNLQENTYIIKILHNIIQKISKICEDKSIELLINLNKDVLIKLYEILYMYKDILYISDLLLIKIKEILEDKIKNDTCVILNPTLEDLFEHNLYKLHHENQLFIIPLWHDELVYDISGCDFYVKCFPILPENIKIDQDNNIVIELIYDIKDVFNEGGINVEYGNKWFRICSSNIRLIEKQSIIYKGYGIPIINSENIYDINKKSNIIVELFLENASFAERLSDATQNEEAIS